MSFLDAPPVLHWACFLSRILFKLFSSIFLDRTSTFESVFSLLAGCLLNAKSGKGLRFGRQFLDYFLKQNRTDFERANHNFLLAPTNFVIKWMKNAFLSEFRWSRLCVRSKSAPCGLRSAEIGEINFPKSFQASARSHLFAIFVVVVSERDSPGRPTLRSF